MMDEKKDKKLMELEEAKKQAQEYLDGWKRAKADLINYKNEESQRMEEFAKYARQRYVLEILPIVDSFDLAAKRIPKEDLENESVKGMMMIKAQLDDFLKANGVEAIVAQGEKFNPEFHEAAQVVECQDQESGTIIEETQKGYMINGCLLRPAKVKVSK